MRIPRARGDAGLSFAEILVSIVILGVCVAVLLGGTTSLPVASTVHRRDALADTILRNWAEAVSAKGLVTSSTLCASDATNPYSVDMLKTGNYLPQNFSTAGFIVSSPVVNTWNGTAMPAFQVCDPSPGFRFARVGLTLTTTDTVHPVSQSLEVVVAQP